MKPTLMTNLGPTPKLTRTIFSSLFLTLILALTPATLAAAPVCQDLFLRTAAAGEIKAASKTQGRTSRSPAAQRGVRALETVKQIKMMSYNVKDMFLKLGKYEDMSPRDFKRFTDAPVKSDFDLQGLATAIKEEAPDFIVMEEVEDIETLAAFADRFLGGTYAALLVPGNDQRGIHIGYLVKKDLPLQLTIESHKDATWIDPLDDQEHQLFSRDAPALLIRRQGAAPDSAPALIFIGNHAKSKRNRNGDPQSTILRTGQMKEIASIVGDYQKQYGADVPIVVGGDFNTDVRKSPEMQPIREILKDPFDIKGIQGMDRTTHTFHPRRGPTEYNQLDALFVTPNLADNVIDIEAYRYKDANGKEKPLPRTFNERKLNPSDHYPVVVTLSTNDIFPEAYARAAGE